jgi:hypothetical protein
MHAESKGEDQILVTTIGDLILAVMDADLEAVHNDEQACHVANLVVNNILSLSAKDSLLFSNVCGARTLRDA